MASHSDCHYHSQSSFSQADDFCILYKSGQYLIGSTFLTENDKQLSSEPQEGVLL